MEDCKACKGRKKNNSSYCDKCFKAEIEKRIERLEDWKNDKERGW